VLQRPLLNLLHILELVNQTPESKKRGMYVFTFMGGPGACGAVKFPDMCT